MKSHREPLNSLKPAEATFRQLQPLDGATFLSLHQASTEVREALITQRIASQVEVCEGAGKKGEGGCEGRGSTTLDTASFKSEADQGGASLDSSGNGHSSKVPNFLIVAQVKSQEGGRVHESFGDRFCALGLNVTVDENDTANVPRMC